MLIYLVVLLTLLVCVILPLPIYYCILLIVLSILFSFFMVYFSLLPSLLVILIVIVYVGAMIILIGYMSAVTPNLLISRISSTDFLFIIISVIAFVAISLVDRDSIDFFRTVSPDRYFVYLYTPIGSYVFLTIMFFMLYLIVFSSQTTYQSSPIRKESYIS